MQAWQVYHVCVIGPRNSGKTSLINRFVCNSYVHTYQPTEDKNGVMYNCRSPIHFSEDCLFEIEEISIDTTDEITKVLEYPITGEKMPKSRDLEDDGKEIMYRKDMEEAKNPLNERRPRHAFIVCLAVNDHDKYKHDLAKKIVERIVARKIENPLFGEVQVPILLVGTRADVRAQDRAFSVEEGIQTYQNRGVLYMECSARFDRNIARVFSMILDGIKGLVESSDDEEREKVVKAVRRLGAESEDENEDDGRARKKKLAEKVKASGADTATAVKRGVVKVRDAFFVPDSDEGLTWWDRKVMKARNFFRDSAQSVQKLLQDPATVGQQGGADSNEHNEENKTTLART